MNKAVSSEALVTFSPVCCCSRLAVPRLSSPVRSLINLPPPQCGRRDLICIQNLNVLLSLLMQVRQLKVKQTGYSHAGLALELEVLSQQPSVRKLPNELNMEAMMNNPHPTPPTQYTR